MKSDMISQLMLSLADAATALINASNCIEDYGLSLNQISAVNLRLESLKDAVKFLEGSVENEKKNKNK